MERKIELCLVYRDMWQSSGKYVPRVDQLLKVAQPIIDMGCFSRIETNGGASEQVNLLYGENPNSSVRAWCKPFNDAGIQTIMLERGLNSLRMFPTPKDVRELMCKVKKAQGVDIMRSFDGLNDHRNLELSIKYAKKYGLISQTAIAITHSPVHTLEYYMNFVDKIVEYGADEICLKDMAGVGRPVFLGKLVKEIKTKYPHLRIQYHGHTGPGFAMASILEVCKAGADIIDVAMEPLSWGMVHADVIAVVNMLQDAGFDVPNINMKAYMKVRALTQEFIDDFLGFFINPRNRICNSMLIGCGLPGGMMGSMMSDLQGVQNSINRNLIKEGKEPLSENEMLTTLFDEVRYVWPKLGYPPLVTPFSQYVKNVALMNILQASMGKPRFSMMDENTWGMILGKMGRLPGEVADELKALANEKGYEFYTGNPQDNYPDDLDNYRQKMQEKGWEEGEDEEELFEFAMHERQYLDFKSGIAKERFMKELDELEAKKLSEEHKQEEPIDLSNDEWQRMIIDRERRKNPNAKAVVSPCSGIVIWEISNDGESTPPPEGTKFEEEEIICYVLNHLGANEQVKALYSGKLIDIIKRQGAIVKKGDVIAFID